MSQTKAQLIGDLTQALEFITTASTPADGLYLKAANQIALATNSVDRITAGTSELVINESGASVDFRVEGDTDANLLFVDASTDRVGIGTSSPAALCHINKTSGETIYRASVASNSTIGLEIVKTGSTTQSWRIVDGQTVNGKLEFHDLTNSATRMCIDGSGRVGIGTTAPNDRLEVAGAILTTAPLASHQTSMGVFEFNSNVTSIRSYGSTTGTGQLSFNTGGGGGTTDTPAMRIDASQRVGIGTTSPGRRLHVSEASDTRVGIDSTNNSTSGLFLRVISGGSTVGASTIRITNTGSLEFWTGTSGDSQRARITEKGEFQMGQNIGSNCTFRQAARDAGNTSETFTSGDMGMGDNWTGLINISLGGTTSLNHHGGCLVYWTMPRGGNSVIHQTLVTAYKGSGITTFSVSVSGNSLVVSKDSDVGVFVTVIGGGGSSIF